MSEMIERVARALATSREQSGGRPFEAYGKHARRDLFDDAETVIAAMREPTKAMIEAGYREDTTSRSRFTGDVWKDMIDAALAKKPG